MCNEKIKIKILDFLSRFIGDMEIEEDEDIFSSGLVNSLFAMQLILFIEKEYNFKVNNEDLDIENFNSIRSITEYIEKKIL